MLSAHFGQSGAAFGDGDFNHDGMINTNDFTLLATRFSTFSPPPTSPPSPFSVAPVKAGDFVGDLLAGSIESTDISIPCAPIRR